jgi:hypothetical protein
MSSYSSVHKGVHKALNEAINKRGLIMKRFASVAIVVLIIAVFSAQNVFSQNPKEKNFSGTHYYGQTHKVYKLDQGEMIIQFEPQGVRVNDDAKELFHEASVHIAGLVFIGKTGSRLRAFETWTDANGDKVVWELTEKASPPTQPGTVPGVAKIVSGTGKYVGIQGTMDWVVRNPMPFPEGTGRGICREEIKLVLPE